ncbi:DUF5677 domain-containing protein [Paenibacillus odorifer]|uniref:DUF5677 domain-containing protein n=1 Tax=Paenibacillus odorifer TaxID=189426 RepID=UPI00096D2F43|nr:DUF5677 domain-containing protein [Paenibacillus odorifer]OME55129.1 hypothetical protein BSK61_13760 [Paenibacillus odorifer]
MKKHDEVVKYLNEDILDLLDIIEKEVGFQSSSRKSAGIMYHLYSRMKRTYSVVKVVLNSDIPNNYIEVIPSLRLLVENFFHLLYLNGNSSTDEVKYNEYLLLTDYQFWKLGKGYSELLELKGSIHSDYIDLMNEKYTNKGRPRVPEHLLKINELSKKTGQYDVYLELYSIFSSYTHYNPITKTNYGTQIEEVFSFNKFEYDKNMDFYIRTYICRISLLSIVQIATFFDLQHFLDSDLKSSTEKWLTIDARKNRSNTE